MTDRSKTPPVNHDAKAPADAELDASMLLEHAISHLLCVRWTYNRTEMQAQPYILYRRKNGVYLDAVVTERAGETPSEIKLGSFKLTGLTNLVLMNELFAPKADIRVTDDARYAEGVIVSATR